MRERQRDKQGEREGERERERKGESDSVWDQTTTTVRFFKSQTVRESDESSPRLSHIYMIYTM